uniref:ATP synthase subunit a n=1 Tax=Henschiella sp. PJ-2015 TaxID=1663422 RepID=A0A342D245_9HEMI|nr:ATP synthase F0 subunit 6 [Henschiella sp. PJ-2015]
MMMNLFSTFDPSTNMFMSLNWLSTFLFMFLFPMYYWIIPNMKNMLIMVLINKLITEFKTLVNFKHLNLIILFISLFMFIMFNNLMGLLPYIFTSSSHLMFSLTISLSMWLSLMLFGWINNYNHMFIHLIPSGTPMILTPFMVCIETVSNIIRPISLSVRLTANMIAGHLLMCLLGNNLINSNMIMIMFLLMIQMMLMLFELAVAMIQAYVFSILSTLYSNEVIYEK